MAHYAYDAWGNVKELQPESGISKLNPFRYRGYYYDVETGLYYLQTRYYDPETGRFISSDSIEYLDPETLGGLNLYAYCGNNPVMKIDRLGTDWKSFLKGVGDWFVKAGNWVNNNIIQPTVDFFKEYGDIVIAGLLLAGAVVATVLTFGTGTLIAIAAGAIIGATCGALDSYLTGGVLWQGAITGLVVGTFGGAGGTAAGLAAAGMSLIMDHVNRKKFGWDSVGRAFRNGIVAGIFAGGAKKLSDLGADKEGVLVKWIVNLVYSGLSTLLNSALNLTTNKMKEVYGR